MGLGKTIEVLSLIHTNRLTLSTEDEESVPQIKSTYLKLYSHAKQTDCVPTQCIGSMER